MHSLQRHTDIGITRVLKTRTGDPHSKKTKPKKKTKKKNMNYNDLIEIFLQRCSASIIQV